MSDLLIRNIDEAVLAKLRERAKARGLTAEDVARDVLVEATAGPSADSKAAFKADVRALRQTFPSMPKDYSSLDALQEGRAMHFDKSRG